MNSEYIFNLIALFGSFLPTYVGVMRRHQKEKAIFSLNAISLVVSFGNPGFNSMPQLATFPALGLLAWAMTLLWSLSGRKVATLEAELSEAAGKEFR
jgi:hypothetical protein